MVQNQFIIAQFQIQKMNPPPHHQTPPHTHKIIVSKLKMYRLHVYRKMTILGYIFCIINTFFFIYTHVFWISAFVFVTYSS